MADLPTSLPTAQALRQFAEEHEERMRRVAERGAALKAELEATSLEATSADGAVTAVVGAGGVLKDLRFGARAQGLSPEHLRQDVLAAYRAACAKAAQRSTDAVARLIGTDNPAFAMLRDAIPPGTDEEESS